MLYKRRKRSYQVFQSCHFLGDINLSSDQKSPDEDSQSELYRSYDCTHNRSRSYQSSYDWDMRSEADFSIQRILHEAEYKRQTTLKQTVEYIVLSLSRWFVCKIDSWRNVSIYMLQCIQTRIIHFMKHSIGSSPLRMCRRRNKRLRRLLSECADVIELLSFWDCTKLQVRKRLQ